MSLASSIQLGINRLTAMTDQQEARAQSMRVEAGRFQALADKGPTRAVSAFNLFQTPVALADELAALLGPIPDDARILEPSAGLGRLYDAIRLRTSCSVTLIEQSHELFNELQRHTAADENRDLICSDFLECSADRLGTFDFILMNPPFKMGTDIKHIEHARTFLKPGGRLVTLCFAGARQTKRYADDPQMNWLVLPSDSFKESNTGASVARMTFNQPGV